MNFYFENNTVNDPSVNKNPAFDSAEDHINHKLLTSSYNYGYRRYDGDRFREDIENMKSDFNLDPERIEAVLNTKAEDIETVQSMKNLRRTIAAVVGVVFLLLAAFYLFILHTPRTGYYARRGENALLMLAFMGGFILGEVIGEPIAKAVYANKMPDSAVLLHNKYRFSDDCVVLTNERKTLMMKYSEISVFDKYDYYEIMYGSDKYRLDKTGFSCTTEYFEQFIESKGHQIRKV